MPPLRPCPWRPIWLEVPWQGQTTVHVTAQDDQGVVGLAALLDNQVLATAEDGDLSFDLIPGALDGVKPGSAYTITARATDAAGNVGTATLAVRFGPAPETPTPAGAAASPTGTPSPRSGTLLPDVSVSGTPVPPEPSPLFRHRRRRCRVRDKLPCG